MQKAILIIDFGSQYTQLIARKIRELNVFCVIFTYKKVTLDLINELNPSGIILSGGPNSVLDKNSPKLPLHILSSNIPILGINMGRVGFMSEIEEQVKKIVIDHLGIEESKVTPESKFIDDLGADSLDTVELVMAFEEKFGIEIPDDAAETIVTVKDAIDFIENNK